MKLEEGYISRTGASKKLFERAKKVFAGGVNHNARFYEPYPLFVKKARGQHIWDQDGNKYVDYWMGHMALILGHSPAVVTDALDQQLKNGTHFGLSSELSVELGEEIQLAVPCAELVRFCNTGAEATMYLVRLARAFSRKRTVIKMAGGWHGYSTELNKGVSRPFDRPESAGILPEEQAHVHAVRFNDLEAARRAVKAGRDDVAAVVLEPVLGAGGCIPADREYLRGLRELTERAGVLLAFDEIITGFRVALGGAQETYGVKPDLAALGKVVGGGLPIGLVCGRSEILSLADPSKKGRFVSIGGGTFSENPLTLTAGLASVRYLRRNANTLYSRLEKEGSKLRSGVDRVLLESGIDAHTTGMGSLFLTHFGVSPRNAEEASRSDKGRASKYAFHLMSNGIFLMPGHPGGISTAHTEHDLSGMIGASSAFRQ